MTASSAQAAPSTSVGVPSGTLPPGVDPCGEKGEFHTYAFAGPMFRRPIAVETGEIVERDGFVFADLLPQEPV